MIFFDSSYIDYSFKARLRRQLAVNSNILGRAKKTISSKIDTIGTFFFYLGKKLSGLRKTKDTFNQERWQRADLHINRGGKVNNTQGEDLTVDGYITKHGGIESNIDGKVYTTKASYMEHVKSNDCIIKDF